MTKATEIPMRVKKRVWWRDDGLCIICGQPGNPEAHYISRAHGGKGIEENIVTLCRRCHSLYDGTRRQEFGIIIKNYLRSKYPEWDEHTLIYRKWQQPSDIETLENCTQMD